MTIDNYPVGWDGKPIPYWLYKLHGLGNNDDVRKLLSFVFSGVCFVF
jgi:hypothetical protein